MNRLLLIPVLMIFSGCATHPKTYQPPDAAKLKASTQRVAIAVTNAHQHARQAQTKVSEAGKLASEVKTEASKIKDVPPELVAKLDTLDGELNDATRTQIQLEADLKEADAAKAQVETDKADYFGKAQMLANQASDERNARIGVETKLHWYRMHWWGAWIVFGLGVVACIILGLLKIGGKLPFI